MVIVHKLISLTGDSAVGEVAEKGQSPHACRSTAPLKLSMHDLRKAIVIASSEAYIAREGMYAPTITGGLGSFVTSLATSLSNDYNQRALLVMPAHGGMYRSLEKLGLPLYELDPQVHYLKVRNGDVTQEFELKASLFPGSSVPFFMVNTSGWDNLFHHEEGKLYGYGYEYDSYRYLQFNKVAAHLAAVIDASAVHINDWPTGYIPLLLRRMYNAAHIPVLGTIHNLKHSNRMSGGEFYHQTGLGDHYLYDPFAGSSIFHMECADPLKTLITWSDIINTVSRNYVQETATNPRFGYEFTGLLGSKLSQGRYASVLNCPGIEFDPRTDRFIAHRYSSDDVVQLKPLNKLILQQELGLDQGADRFMIALKSRFSDQKGYDVLFRVLPSLLSVCPQLQVLVMANANPSDTPLLELRARYQELAGSYPRQLVVRDFDRRLESLLFAGADWLVMPSKFEPCGIAQLNAFVYGTPVIGSAVGGLLETIEHGRNGLLFRSLDHNDLLASIIEAYSIFKAGDPMWNMVRYAMHTDYSSRKMAGEYLKLYERAREERSRAMY